MKNAASFILDHKAFSQPPFPYRREPFNRDSGDIGQLLHIIFQSVVLPTNEHQKAIRPAFFRR